RCQRVVAPRGDVRTKEHALAIRTHEPGGGQTDSIKLVVGGELVDDFGDGAVNARRVARRGVPSRLGDDAPGVVDDARGDLRAANVYANRVQLALLSPYPNVPPQGIVAATVNLPMEPR